MHLVTYERRGDLGPDSSGGESEATTDLERLEYGRPGATRVGALVTAGARSGDIVDLNRALALRLALDDAGAPEAEADSLLPPNMLSLLERGELALTEARRALDWACARIGRYDAPDLERAGVVLSRRGVRLRAPVPRPGKILGVARNYMAHAQERGQNEPPVEPVLFLKAGTSVAGPGDEIELPRASTQVDYEGELAVVIGRRARAVPVERALAYVAGYTAANDVSARDFQKVRGQSFIGKSCDGFAPMGPALVTRDELPEPQKLRLTTTVSGERRQAASTGDMIFSVAEIIAFASNLMTLEPGDVLLTGTPSGVGAAATPPRWLADGDVVEVEVEGIGRLRNYFRGSGPAGAIGS